MNASAAARRGLLVPVVFVILAVTGLLALGTWQIQRKGWKEDLVSTLDKRLGDAPIALPPASQWGSFNPTDEFIRVRFTAAFLPGRRLDDSQREARLYTGGGSALRTDIKGPGYFVFAPARLPDGSTVVVNRGYVANPRPIASTPPVALPPGPVEVVGVIRWPERPGWFDTTHSDTEDLWFVRDPAAMAAQNGWGYVAPFYIDMEAPDPPGGVPKPGPIQVHLRNEHLQYAITWFGLAAVVMVMFVIWLVRWRHGGEAATRGSTV
jgi:cytochrome oxidase assembly protein ShyY1